LDGVADFRPFDSGDFLRICAETGFFHQALCTPLIFIQIGVIFRPLKQVMAAAGGITLRAG
jgi:hypothetical protein